MKNPEPIKISEKIQKTLKEYAWLIYEYNKIINITGLKDIESIYNELVIESIRPFMYSDVPRGTLFVDIGTGAGIPGIPLLLYYGENIKAVLIDSNNKKIKFLEKAIDVLGLATRTTVIQGRAEELAYEKNYRDTFDFAVSRAFAHPLMALEYGLPFVKVGGWMYIYYATILYSSCLDDRETIAVANNLPEECGIKSDTTKNDTHFDDMAKLVKYLDTHSRILGGHVATREEVLEKGVHEGLLFIKDEPTPQIYPRKHAVVKRDVEKLRGLYAN